MRVNGRRGLTMIVWILVAGFGTIPSVRAQIDVNRELARAQDAWKNGTPADRNQAMDRLAALGNEGGPAAPLVIAVRSVIPIRPCA